MSNLAVCAALALVLTACGGSEPADPIAAGKRLFSSQGCLACHMPGGTGSMMAPPLRSLGTHWTREKLADYMADPEAFASRDPRLAELKKRFRSPMAPIVAERADRLRIADYVLSL